eukprot:1133494-Pelagomonas_calceolata.AAC.2
MHLASLELFVEEQMHVKGGGGGVLGCLKYQPTLVACGANLAWRGCRSLQACKSQMVVRERKAGQSCWHFSCATWMKCVWRSSGNWAT